MKHEEYLITSGVIVLLIVAHGIRLEDQSRISLGSDGWHRPVTRNHGENNSHRRGMSDVVRRLFKYCNE